MNSHLSERELKAFLDGGADSARRAHVLRHLLTGCQRCTALAGKLSLTVFPQSQTDKILPFYSSLDEQRLLDLARQAAAAVARLDQEKREAPRLARELLALRSPEDWASAIQDKKYVSWGLGMFLVQQAKNEFRQDPARGQELAGLAVSIADSLPAGQYPEQEKSELKAVAYAAMANALRLQEKFLDAQAAVSHAYDSEAEGLQDGEALGFIEQMQALIHRDLGEFEKASHCLHHAARIYRYEVRDTGEYGTVLLTLATVYRHYDPEAGYQVATEALLLLEDENPELTAYGYAQAILCLVEKGEVERAALEWKKQQRRLLSVKSHRFQLNLSWLAARIDALLYERTGLDPYRTTAEGAYLETRKAFVDEGMLQEYALASLQLSELYHAADDPVSAAASLAQAIEVLVSLGIRHDLITALRQFERAAGRAAISERMRKKTYSLLVRHWKRPPPPTSII
jgi:hypothetical protein